jgi:outer membrane protein assembly factor BamB
MRNQIMAANRSRWLGCVLVLSLTVVIGCTSAAADNDPAAKALEPAWSLEGTWTGVAGDENEGVVFALDSVGKCLELDSTGKTRREFTLPEASVSALRLAHWPGTGGRTLLTFRLWSTELRAYNEDGKQLWSYPRGSGIDDVWASNRPGDKSGDVIVGYNGGDGLHVLDSKGQLRWKSTAVANVWHVCAGNVRGDGKLQVVTTSADGNVHVFESDGSEGKTLDPGLYANMVRVGKLSEKDKQATIFVAGSTQVPGEKTETAMVIALSGDGTQKWKLKLPAGARSGVDSASLAPGEPWLAVGLRDGNVYAIDAENGSIIATASDQGMVPEVGWMARKAPGKPLMVVATGGKLNAFNVASAK